MTIEELPSLFSCLEDSGFDMEEFQDVLRFYVMELQERERKAYESIDTSVGLITYLEIQNRLDLAIKLLNLVGSES